MVVPEEKEATCRGAAIIAAVAAGVFPDLETACGSGVLPHKRYVSHPGQLIETRYALYKDALQRLFGQPGC